MPWCRRAQLHTGVPMRSGHVLGAPAGWIQPVRSVPCRQGKSPRLPCLLAVSHVCCPSPSRCISPELFQFAALEGSTSCTDCAWGGFSPTNGSHACMRCPVGKHTQGGANRACYTVETNCLSGRYTHARTCQRPILGTCQRTSTLVCSTVPVHALTPRVMLNVVAGIARKSMVLASTARLASTSHLIDGRWHVKAAPAVRSVLLPMPAAAWCVHQASGPYRHKTRTARRGRGRETACTATRARRPHAARRCS